MSGTGISGDWVSGGVHNRGTGILGDCKAGVVDNWGTGLYGILGG